MYALCLHDDAATLALSAVGRCRFYCRLANILKGRLDKLARDGGALDIPVRSQRLRRLVRLLRVDDAIGIRL
jgi:hypothetical protein